MQRFQIQVFLPQMVVNTGGTKTVQHLYDVGNGRAERSLMPYL
jgi:hypothetical protein